MSLFLHHIIMKLLKKIKGNIYGMILWRILLLLIVYSISRALFLGFNQSHFPDLDFITTLKLFFVGMRFDLTSIAILSIPFVLWNIIPHPIRYAKKWRIVSNFLFYPIQVIMIGSNFADIVYYRFTLKRTSADIFHFLHQEGDGFLGLIPQFIHDFSLYFIIWIVLTILFIWGCQLFQLKQNKDRFSFLYLIKHLPLTILFAALFVLAARGGFQLKPISNITAGQYAKPVYTPIVLNTPFSIIKTLDQQGVKTPEYYSWEECVETFNPRLDFKRDSVFRKKNIVVIILESFSAEHSAFFNKNIPNYIGYTPFLDSLASQSLAFKGWANGKRSIEGIPAVTAGIPSWMPTDYVSSVYGNNKISSLASLLKKEGYRTAFFHGGNNGTMSFDAFCNIAGFENYYGRNEYNDDKDYDGKWGIFDEPFFQYFAHQLDTIREPFFTSIFSLSSHHPYTIPKEHVGQFRKGPLPIQESIMYADFALRRFFTTARETDWYKNTIFVLTADHTSEAYLPFYKTSVGQYSIPILFFDPEGSIQADTTQTVQQIDIMPSILDFLNYPYPFNAFGRSIHDSTQHYAMQYTNNTYQLIQGDFALQFIGDKVQGFYDYKTDSLLDNNIKGTDIKQRMEMEKLCKVLIQEYIDLLNTNKLSLSDEKVDDKTTTR